LSLNESELFKRFNGVNLQSCRVKFDLEGQNSSFNGCCRVGQKFSESTVEIVFDLEINDEIHLINLKIYKVSPFERLSKSTTKIHFGRVDRIGEVF
jgi:hypothetical protein